MADRGPKTLWRLRMTFWLLRYGYRRNPISAFFFSGEDCWGLYYRSGYTAHAAVWKNASYRMTPNTKDAVDNKVVPVGGLSQSTASATLLVRQLFRPVEPRTP